MTEIPNELEVARALLWHWATEDSRQFSTLREMTRSYLTGGDLYLVAKYVAPPPDSIVYAGQAFVEAEQVCEACHGTGTVRAPIRVVPT